jgi:cytochrome c6
MAQHTIVRFASLVLLASMLAVSFLVNHNGNHFVVAFQPIPKIQRPSSMANLKPTTTAVSVLNSKSDVDVDHQQHGCPITMMASVCLLSTMMMVVSLPSPAWSQPPDITKGQVLFQANCAGCHAGGNNYVQEKRTLRKDDIQQYRGSTDPAVITNFVRNGMPHKLLPMRTPMEENDYNDVVAYVLDQALGEKW